MTPRLAQLAVLAMVIATLVCSPVGAGPRIYTVAGGHGSGDPVLMMSTSR